MKRDPSLSSRKNNMNLIEPFSIFGQGFLLILKRLLDLRFEKISHIELKH